MSGRYKTRRGKRTRAPPVDPCVALEYTVVGSELEKQPVRDLFVSQLVCFTCEKRERIIMIAYATCADQIFKSHTHPTPSHPIQLMI